MSGDTTPMVTVIVPCYKVARFLPQCLDSVLGQTYSNVRVLAVDDCSPDESADIIREYERKDSRVKGIFHKVNSGVSIARNSGIEETDSPWLVFLDGDDWMPPNAIETLLERQREYDVDIVCGNALEYNEDGSETGVLEYPLHGRKLLTIEKNLDDVIQNQSILCVCWGKLIRTSLVKSSGILFDASLRHAQDTLFTHSLVLRMKPRVLLDYDEVAYCYRQFAQSCVHAIKLDKRLGYISILITELDKLAMELGCSRRLIARKAAEYFWGIRKFSENGQERKRRISETIESPLFTEHIYPVLSMFGKFKHRLLVKLLARGYAGLIKFW